MSHNKHNQNNPTSPQAAQWHSATTPRIVTVPSNDTTTQQMQQYPEYSCSKA